LNPFLKEILFLKLYSRNRIITDVIFIALIAFLCIHAVVIGLLKLGINPFDSILTLYLLSGGIAFLIAVVIFFFQDRNFIDLLIDIDARFNLKDRISTAYEYYSLNRKTEFSVSVGD